MSTLMLATTGGHLSELDALFHRFPSDDPCVWVTHPTEQSTSLLAGRDVEYVPYVGVRDVPGVLRAVVAAHRLLVRRRRAGQPLTRVVSTGSGIALGYLPYLAARGVECHFVESAARVSGPSLTGRLLRHVPGVHTYTRYRAWADRRWHYAGNDFDLYERADRRDRLPDRVSVLVTLGTAAEYPFPRLVTALAPVLAEYGTLARRLGRPVDVLWQLGGTEVAVPLPGRVVGFLGGREFAETVDGADLVIGHAGLGTALAALSVGRVPVLVPRCRRHGEAGDDHQRDLLDELARRDLALPAEPETVGAALLHAAVLAGVRRRVEVPAFELRGREEDVRGRHR